MRCLFLHVTRRVVLDYDPTCDTNDRMLKAARHNAQSPLHRVLRALVTGMREAPDENDGANQAAAQQMLLVPWAMTQLTHKLHVPSKRGGLQSRCS